MSSGIYKITNKVNGKCYIGSAMNIQKRWNTHIFALSNEKHHSGHLQNAWKKYGKEAFEFSIIELCFPFFLIAREQYYMDTLHPEYNISPTAGSPLGVKHSEETCRTKSEKMMGRVITPEWKAKIGLGNSGKSPSAETRKKQSIAKMGKVSGNKGKNASSETRKKQSIAKLGKKHSPEHIANLKKSAILRYLREKASKL